jgi:hypothetical protein
MKLFDVKKTNAGIEASYFLAFFRHGQETFRC